MVPIKQLYPYKVNFLFLYDAVYNTFICKSNTVAKIDITSVCSYKTLQRN